MRTFRAFTAVLLVGAVAVASGGCSRKAADEPLSRAAPAEEGVRLVVTDRARAERAVPVARAYDQQLEHSLAHMRAARCDLLESLTRYDADEYDHGYAIEGVRTARDVEVAAFVQRVMALRRELTKDEWKRLVEEE